MFSRKPCVTGYPLQNRVEIWCNFRKSCKTLGLSLENIWNFRETTVLQQFNFTSATIVLHFYYSSHIVLVQF